MAEAIGGNAAEKLRSLVHRIERLEGEKRGIAEDIREVFKEAKNAGYDVPALRALVKERRDADKAQALRDQLEVLRNALAGLAELPLGKAAIARTA